ncbi:hypothetical protein EKO27_g9467 [Xylaria grammica]|uniref:Nudix hydrolase domain-containing protein n=1 Tax=Xylaria grammica TaxID=363999 RepID=A0A439CU27_9PEZI|nr:hypothetical protein EKO27_g9467 [Xylaria grammica]
MPKRPRTLESDQEEHFTQGLPPASEIETEIGLLRGPASAPPRILVAGMVGGDDTCIPEDMPPSGGLNFLVGKRLVAPGSGTWSYPCGLIQSGERILTCAARIVREQTGLDVTGEDIIRTTENVMDGEHYVTVFVFCGFPSGGQKPSMVRNVASLILVIIVTNQTDCGQDKNPEWADWHWSTVIYKDAVDMSCGKEPGKPVFAPVVSLYDSSETRPIDWDREPGISI